MTEAAFFYGTLMATEIIGDASFAPDLTERHYSLVVLCGRSAPPAIKTKKLASLQLTPALLKEHRRYAVKHATYPGLLESNNPNDQVEGILCEGLTIRDVEALDDYEGNEYRRQYTKVIKIHEDGNHSEGIHETASSCQVYLWIADKQQLQDHDWDYSHWRKHHLPTTVV